MIRLSGASASTTVQSLLLEPRNSLPRRRPFVAGLQDRDGDAVDRVLITFFPAPFSYTGEDVIEISCHGSPVITRLILEACLARGCRTAEPGEFTMRAFLNGKMDLAQAEAVRDLIESQTRFQARIAARQAEGGLSRELNPLKEELVTVISHLETGLEFVEEDVHPDDRSRILQSLAEVRNGVERLRRSFDCGKLVRQGLQVALAGKPNAGKSSLFNSLLRRKRAIVTPVPGTTRDALTEAFSLQGVPVRLADTAGIRATRDEVEKLGVEKSLEFLVEADVVLFVLDRSRPFDEEDRRIWREVRGGTCILVQNKEDLPPVLEVPEDVRAGCDAEVAVSALLETGLENLCGRLLEAALPGEGRLETEQIVVTDLRHQQCLERAADRLARAEGALRSAISEEYPLHDLRKCLEAIGEITGETTVEDILGRIFSSFCIGK